MLTTLKNIALVGFTLPSMLRRGLAREVKYQQEVLQVMTVLPGKYRYEQVEAAINASVFTQEICMNLLLLMHLHPL